MEVARFTLPAEAITPKLESVLRFAARRHAGQVRDGAAKEPYIQHSIEVAGILWACGIRDEDTLSGAICHDVVEDTVGIFETRESLLAEIANRFGDAAALIVREATDPEGLPKAERRRHQSEGMPLRSAATQNVKVGDKSSNLISIMLSPPVDWDAEKKRGYADFCDEVVAKCGKANSVLVGLYRDLRREFDARTSEEMQASPRRG